MASVVIIGVVEDTVHALFSLSKNVALKKVVGTTQSVISQLESAEYKGHSLSMLERIGKALNKRVEVRFAPLTPVQRTT